MYLEEHCRRTEEEFGQDYREIHAFLDRNFDGIAMARWSMLTEGDWYPEKRPDPFSHRRINHHQEGILVIIEKFKDRYDPDIIYKIAAKHICDDYNGYLPLKSDFDNPDFIKKYHR